MLPLRFVGAFPCGQEIVGMEATAAPAAAVLRILRRDSLDMVDRQSLPEKRLPTQKKLFFCGLGVGRGRRRWRRSFGELNAPNIFFSLETHDANLIGFAGANVADPHDSKSGFSP